MIPGLSFEIHFCLTERVTGCGRRGWETKEFLRLPKRLQEERLNVLKIHLKHSYL